MKEALKGLFGSKKALTGMAAVATSALLLLAQKHGYGLDPASTKLLIGAVLGLAGTFIVGQGVADWGKEAAKIQTAAYTVIASAERLELEELDDLADDEDDEPEKAAPKLLTE